MKFKKNIAGKICDNAYLFIFMIISIAVSVVVCILNNKGLITNGISLLPHVITFATIVLGLVSLVFTIIIGIRDRSFYKYVKSKRPDILEQLFGCLKFSVYDSLMLVFLSMVALIIRDLSDFIKYMFIFLISCSFSFLAITTVQMFRLSVQMLKIDDKEL